MITGHHEVQVFIVGGDKDTSYPLPEGWKPFAAQDSGDGRVFVYARKWVRDSKVDAVAYAEAITREAVSGTR